MWQRQRDIEDWKHILKCISAMRHVPVTRAKVLGESGNPWVLTTKYGMLRAATPRQWGLSHPYIPDHVIYVQTVIILPKYRGTGRSNELMKELIDRYGRKTIMLGVDPNNKRARALYKKYGFRSVHRSAAIGILMRRDPD